MNTLVPLLPETAPFSSEQRAWVNGYLAGLHAATAFAKHSASSSPASVKPTNGPLLFLFGSQTGSCENLARKFAKLSRSRGFDAKVLSMEEYFKVDLSSEKRVAILTSTYGDGEMPDNALPFWNFIKNGTAPRLENVEYSVLALGDSNYVQFCEAGKRFDNRLEELGAKRIFPRVDCDVDYESPSETWFNNLMESLGANTSPSDTLTLLSSNVTSTTAASTWTKSNPFPAALKTNRPLNGEGSAKDTRHIEILLGDSGLTYEAGDALGVMPTNCPAFVREILSSAGLDGSQNITIADVGEISLSDALKSRFDLKPFIQSLPPTGISAADLIAPLKKLQPRLYSISSSPKAHPGEVHLTVGVVRFESNGRPISGVCSTFLADRVSSETSVPVFIHHSPGFRPPVDPSLPMIMVGPGTGIAPFRAFLEERQAIAATGKNWLFFGDQKSSCDFLYCEEILAMHKDGFLTKLDTAFSRDQEEKIYVQHRMLEKAAELWDWLQQGAHFYVCGDASRMAKDVDAALQSICMSAGVMDNAAASEYIQSLKSSKRYARDVY